MNVVLIGAGSFVFGATVLQDAFERHRMDGELVMVDLNLEAAEAMAGVGRRMAQETGADCRVWATADRREALPGADFVILSAAPQGLQRWYRDYEILQRAGMPEQVRECGGVGGLIYALRTISLALDVAADMEALSPDAILLDVTNPMPRVVTAVHRFSDIAIYGFCNVAQRGPAGYAWLAELVHRPVDAIDVVTAGLNHFAWLVSIHDAATGENLYPAVEAAIRAGEGAEMAILRRWLDRYGAISVPGVSHAAEYLPTEPDLTYQTSPPYHGTPTERQAHLDRLKAAAAGELDWRAVLQGGSWEHPMDVAIAIANRTPLDLPMLNLPNRGYLTELPDERIVEVPARVRDSRIQGKAVGELPGRAGELCSRVSEVHERVAAGAAYGSRELLEQAIEIDPAIEDKAAAKAVLEPLLAAHQDLLPRFA